MKCIHCAANTNYKTRSSNGFRCQGCKRDFAFEPKRQSFKITDESFRRALNAVSEESTLKFLTEQLWYEVDRRKKRFKWTDGVGIAAVLAVIVFLSAAAIERWWATWALILAASAVLAGCWLHARLSLKRPPSISLFEFGQLVGRWQQIHGPVPVLSAPLLEPYESGLNRSELKEGMEEPYFSFEHAVITDTRTTAALLIENKFHFDHQCIVLSADGYPFVDWKGVVTMLRANPQLEIALLHDASVSGCRLVRRIRQDDWFPELEYRIVDVGLRPSQAESMRLARVESTGAHYSHDFDGLGSKEIRWLENGYTVSVTTLTPRRMMNAINRNFTRLAAVDVGGSSGDGGIWYFGGEDGEEDGAEDTFG